MSERVTEGRDVEQLASDLEALAEDTRLATWRQDTIRQGAAAIRALRSERDASREDAVTSRQQIIALKAALSRKDAALREASNGLDVVPLLYRLIKSGEGRSERGVVEEVTDGMLKARHAKVQVDRALASGPGPTDSASPNGGTP